VINGLTRLSGAKKVSQDDFQKGTGIYIVSFEEIPKVKMAEIQKELGGYKLVKVEAKITSKVAKMDEKWFAGDWALANAKDVDPMKDVAAKPEEVWLLTGLLSEDDKGGRTLTLSKAELPAPAQPEKK
jgi:hypothetical protein